MSYSFDIKDSKDLYHEFKSRSEKYHADKMSSGNAVICAILSWHIVEWIYQEYGSSLKDFSTKRKFQDHVKLECPSLSYMQDIANGSKHRGITMYTPAVKETKSHKGAFSSAFSKAFDVSSLRIELENEVFVYFDDELDKVNSYLEGLFCNRLNVNV
ncbi:hypothetical protein AB4222_13310 [Vibrio splendidus]